MVGTKAVKEESKSEAQNDQGNSPEQRHTEALKLVAKYSKWSFGSGFIPLPAVDLVALTGIQMKMIGEIASLYGQSYSDNKLRGTVSAVIGGSFPQAIGGAGLSSFLKSVPIIGTLSALTFMPIVSAASTHAIGCTFVRHFEDGGDLLSININSMKEDVAELSSKYRKNKGDATEASA